MTNNRWVQFAAIMPWEKIDNLYQANFEELRGQGDDGTDAVADEFSKNKGTMLLDATCFPSDIKYPTDVGLLNHARELTERIIDELHEQIKQPGVDKPRTYREVARKDYLRFTKKRKPSRQLIRNAVRKQLQYVRRNLETIGEQTAQGAKLEEIGEDLQRKHETIKELYAQQKKMYDERTHKVEERIVSIAQPWLRPIVRGKANAAVEFGAKVATARIGGFSFLMHADYENFAEAQYLEKSTEEYRRIFGFYPKNIIGDRVYGNRSNREFCKLKGIRLSGPGLGRKREDAKDAEQEQIYRDSCMRNAIEGDYGTEKRKYGMDLIKAKLDNTTFTAISMGNFVKNAEKLRKLRVLVEIKEAVHRQMKRFRNAGSPAVVPANNTE